MGTSTDDASYGIAIDSNDNVFITGFTRGELTGSSQGFEDIWVAKYSPDGTLKWTQQLGTPDIDVSNSIAIDSSGNVFITGFTRGELID
ncbi:MAG TPA: SBBP repeat-containing protein [Stenomitos sp.]